MTPSATATAEVTVAAGGDGELPVTEPGTAQTGVADDDLVLADVLVEEISIDGMCGVY